MAGAAIAAGQAIARLGGGGGGGGRVRVKVPHEDRNYERSAPFDCFWQCLDCGFQVEAPSVAPSAGRYREEADSKPHDRRPEEDCDRCGGVTWANLREGAVVEALIEQDKMRQETRGQRRGGVLKLASLVMWGALAVGTMRGDGSALFYPLAIATFGVFAHGAYREFYNGKRARYANSGSYPPRPRGRRAHECEGRVRSTGALIAPLSGRACVAYEIGVRHDSRADDEDWSWTLLEQRTAALTVAGDEVGARPHLALRRQLLGEELSDSACRELRKRGIDPHRPGYTFFETIVKNDEFVTAEERGGAWLLRNL